jgi:hypothetical protein
MERTTVHSPEKSVCADAIPLHGNMSNAAWTARLIVILMISTFAFRNKILDAQLV